MNNKYYTQSGGLIRSPEAYALTGAPMFKNRNREKDINAPTAIYKLNLEDGKQYIGKTTNVDRRMNEHFRGNGSEVTKKFKPRSGKVIDEVPGFLADDTEQYHTEKYIKKKGYQNVRGGIYVNSTTLHRNSSVRFNKCKRCGRTNHTKDRCYASSHVDGYRFNVFSDDEDEWC